jgi:hypothetical protein
VCFTLIIAARSVLIVYRPLLKRIEAAGLITRTREPSNERQLRIELTDRDTGSL